MHCSSLCRAAAPAWQRPLHSAKIGHDVSTTASGAPYRCHASHLQLTVQFGHLGSTEDLLHLVLQVRQQASSTTRAGRLALVQVGRPCFCEALQLQQGLVPLWALHPVA